MTVATDGVTAARLGAYNVLKQRHVSRTVYRQPAIERQGWRDWLITLFPDYFGTPETAIFADHHVDFWEWLWAIAPDIEPSPFVGIWPRGGGKTTAAQGGCVALAARRRRRYGLYVSGTQAQANDRIDGVRDMLESRAFAAHYPDVASRAETKYSTSRGWRMNRLTTGSGFRLDAVGLDTGVRGAKFDDSRPDFIVLDDVDEETDSADATDKKIGIVTRRLLPAGSPDVAVLAIQNLVIPDGIFARLAGSAAEPADFLIDRGNVEVVPAIEDFEYDEVDGRVVEIRGRPTWQGMSLAICQRVINREGITAFQVEQQHQVRERGQKIYDLSWWDGRNRYSVHDDALLRTAQGRFMSWDTAESLASTAAYTACVTGDLVPFRGGYALLIRDVWRERVEFTGLLDAIEAKAREWGFHNDAPLMTRGVVIEYASSGRQAVQTFKSQSATMRMQAPQWLAPYIQRFPPLGSKDERGVQAAIIARAGRVWLPEPDASVPWLMSLQREMSEIPQSTYRDQTDALAQLTLFVRDWLRDQREETEQVV